MNEPIWLDDQKIIIFNDMLVGAFGEIEGSVRDQALLNSALVRPRNSYLYNKAVVDLYSLAANYAFGIAKNHAFLDGNKRTAYLSAIVFLKLNGITCAPPQHEIVTNMVALACNEISEEQFSYWLEKHS